MEKYLDGIETVVVGGESDKFARPLDYEWVLDIRNQCIRKNVSFEFRQCGTHFVKDNKNIPFRLRICAGRLGLQILTINGADILNQLYNIQRILRNN